MTWFYLDEEFDDPGEYYGFIYQIENLTNNRLYIGRKYFTQAGYKTVNKKRKKVRKESDWRDYYGSSPELKKDVEQLGKDKFKRTILRLCKTRGECNYMEMKVIFETDAILRSDYYNSWASVKVQASHVKNLLVEGAT